MRILISLLCVATSALLLGSVLLAAELPVISVSPDSLSDSLFTGETSTHTLTIANTGTGDLVFAISTEERAAASAALTVDEVLTALISRGGILGGEVKIEAVGVPSAENTEEVLSRRADVACVVRSATAAAELDVAIVAAAYSEDITDVQNKLLATGQFASVSTLNVRYMTPTLAELEAFDAVMVWSDDSYANASALGDNLAAYVDAGGGVVCAIFEVAGGSRWGLGGRWELEAYYVMARSSLLWGDNQSLGAVADPTHPIMTGVTSFNGGSFSIRPSTTTLIAGSSLIASWSDGKPLVATRKIRSARRVDLGFFPPSSDADYRFWLANTDGDLLMANALTWVAQPSWLEAEPVSGSVPAGGSTDIAVTFNASELYGGNYLANILLASNDPLTPTVTVPASLHVTGVPDIVLPDTLLDYGTRFIHAVIPETLVVANSGTDLLTVSDISSNRPEYTVGVSNFSLNPNEKQKVVVSFAPSTTGPISGTLTITSDDPEEPTRVVHLQGVGAEPPVISVSPDSLGDSLFTGETSTQTLTIANTGVADLVFDISFANVASPAAALSVDEAVASVIARSGVLGGEIHVAAAEALSGKREEEVACQPDRVARVVRSAVAPAARPDVAIVAAAESAALTDVHNKVVATGKFASVSTVNVRYETPTLAELQAFDAVLVWSDEYWGYHYSDRNALGDTLAAYVDAGGGVVCAVWEAAGDPNYRLGGRWESEGYFVIARSSSRCCDYQSLGAVANPTHPIMAGVTSFNGGYNSYRPSTTNLTAGSTLIASWSDGMPLVATRKIRSARRVDLGFFPPSSDAANYGWWQAGTDGDLLMANALAWVAPSRWLSAQPPSGSVPAGGSKDIAVTFDASELYGGNYLANILIASNDPLTPWDTVPASLHVTGIPDIVLSDTLFDYGARFIRVVIPETLVVANSGTDLLTVSDISPDQLDFTVDVTAFSLDPDEAQNVVVSFVPRTPGGITGFLRITSDDPGEPTLIVRLHGVGGEALAVCPQPPRPAYENGSVAIQVASIFPDSEFASLNLVEMSLNGSPEVSLNSPTLVGLNGETAPNAHALIFYWVPGQGESGIWEVCFESRSTTGDSTLHCATVTVNELDPNHVYWEPRLIAFDPTAPVNFDWRLLLAWGSDSTVGFTLPFAFNYLAGVPPLIDTLVGGSIDPEDSSLAGSDISFSPDFDVFEMRLGYPRPPQSTGGAESLIVSMIDFDWGLPLRQSYLDLRIRPLGMEGIVSVDTAMMPLANVLEFLRSLPNQGVITIHPTYSPGCFPLISRANTPPVIRCPISSLGRLPLGEMVTVPGFSFDDPDEFPAPHAFQIVNMSRDGLAASAVHAPVIDGDTFRWQTSDSSTQDVGVWEFCIACSDGIHTSENVCCFTVEVAEFVPLVSFSLGCVSDVLTGSMVCVPLEVHNVDPGRELGGFDLLFTYDASVLTFQGLETEGIGSVLQAAGWEYLTHRVVSTNPALIRIVAIADMNNSNQHPGSLCLDGLVANVCFKVTSDQNAGCESAYLKWYWQNCGDNTASDPTGDILYIVTDPSRGTPYAGGDPNAAPPVPGGGIIMISCHTEAQLATFEGGTTGPDEHPCLNPDTTKPDPVEGLYFVNGKITIICPGDIDDRGDLNLNGLAYEIADAVIYSNYFISGPSVFTVNVPGQTAASDVNADGSPLTVADLVYLIRVITGDALPIAGEILGGGPKASAVGTLDVNAAMRGGQVCVSTASGQDLGAALFVFKCENTEISGVELVGRASQMDVSYAAENGELRVLVYNIQDRARVAAGSGEILNVSTSGSGSVELVSVEAASFMGGSLEAAVAAKVVPTAFALKQNFPNPFNPSTSLAIDFPQVSDYKLHIYNIAGQTVRSFSGSTAAGTLTLTWDGRDARGTRVSSGVYFYSVEAGTFRDVKRMLLLK